MPKMTVSLPDDLYDIAKERGLPVSELLQGASRPGSAPQAGRGVDRIGERPEPDVPPPGLEPAPRHRHRDQRREDHHRR